MARVYPNYVFFRKKRGPVWHAHRYTDGNPPDVAAQPVCGQYNGAYCDSAHALAEGARLCSRCAWMMT